MLQCICGAISMCAWCWLCVIPCCGLCVVHWFLSSSALLSPVFFHLQPNTVFESMVLILARNDYWPDLSDTPGTTPSWPGLKPGLCNIRKIHPNKLLSKNLFQNLFRRWAQIISKSFSILAPNLLKSIPGDPLSRHQYQSTSRPRLALFLIPLARRFSLKPLPQLSSFGRTLRRTRSRPPPRIQLTPSLFSLFFLSPFSFSFSL